MIHDRSSWRIKMRRAVLALISAALPFAYFDGSAGQGQSIMRSPNLNIQSHIPSISVTPRINPNIAGTAVTTIGRTSPNLRTYPGCSYAYRHSDGQCRDQPVSSSDGGGASGASGKGKSNGPRRNVVQTTPNLSTVAGELVAEFDGSADALARRHHHGRRGSPLFQFVGAGFGLFRVT